MSLSLKIKAKQCPDKKYISNVDRQLASIH